MNGVDEIRRAMRATERPDRPSLDLTAIMRDGRRLRRRRRLAGTGAAALSVVVVAVGVAVGVQQTRPEPQPERRGVPAATAPAAGPTASTEEPAPRPLGGVVDTGIRYGADERVLYFVPVEVPQLPEVRIGLVSGRRTADGQLISDFMANDVEGSDRRRGFHQIGRDQSGSRPDRAPVPTFGYFVGPATRIVGTADGRQIAARLARWSEDPRVVIFWFDPAQLAPGVELDGIVARDAQGRRL